MESQKPLLVSVIGPTAIGKTSMAIAIAKGLNTEIISADSRQFYKEMNIGTAVPSKEELNEIKHHFIQNKSIFNEYNVGDFEKEAIEFLNKKFFSNNSEKTFSCFVMVGGSGLYVDAVLKGLDYFPEINPQIRRDLNSKFKEKGIEYLQNQLKKVDPEYYKQVDIQNPHRLIRALEIYVGSGKPYSSFLNQESKKRNFKNVIIGLAANREIIYERINRRVDIMIKSGLIEEAKSLFPHKDKNALQTVGYRELFDYFDGKISKEKAIEEIKKNTRRFAKRQLTWYRKNPDVHWFDYKVNPDEVLAFIEKLS